MDVSNPQGYVHYAIWVFIDSLLGSVSNPQGYVHYGITEQTEGQRLGFQTHKGTSITQITVYVTDERKAEFQTHKGTSITNP